jgi:YedE family putative selenium metabolism protein
VDTLLIVVGGLAIGGLGAFLAVRGNPANSGICVSCFMENLAGSLGLHGNGRMSYMRPELAGFVLGSLASALAGREVRPRTGPRPLLCFLLGAVLIMGCSVFMGCPIKMMLRLGAGDMTAAAGFAGVAAGVWMGVRFLRAGLDPGAPSPGGGAFQWLPVPFFAVVLLILVAGFPGVLREGTTGPAIQRAPFALALSAGLVIGALSQRSRFCVTGSFSNVFLARDWTLMRGLAALLIFSAAVNLAAGVFHFGLLDQPGSHPYTIWNFLSMALVGFASVIAGGCPFRQLILAGEGSIDAGIIIFGMLFGGAVVHQWGIVSTAAGPTPAGKAAVLFGFAFCFGIVRMYRKS